MKTPLTHDECVIHRKAIDFVYSVRLDLFVCLLVTGQVGRRAGRRKRARKRENDSTLALEEICGRDILPCEGIWSSDLLIANASLEDHIRNRVALLQVHFCLSGKRTRTTSQRSPSERSQRSASHRCNAGESTRRRNDGHRRNNAQHFATGVRRRLNKSGLCGSSYVFITTRHQNFSKDAVTTVTTV